MFRIGEFSKLTQVTIRMLRYYDEMNLLKPAHIDTWTGYRLYSADQIPILNKIAYLRDSGFTVAEMLTILTTKNDTDIIEQLNTKYSEIEKSIQQEQDKLHKIKIAQKALLNEKNEMHYNIVIKAIPSYYVLSLRKIIPDYYAEGMMWKELSAFAETHQIAISPETFSIYHDSEYKELDVDVEVCVPVKNVGKSMDCFVFRNTEAVALMASTMVYGDFSNIAKVYRTFAQWLEDNSHYRMTSPSRQIVHRGPWNEEDPEKYVTEIQIPLEKN